MNEYKALIDQAFFGNVESREKLIDIANEMVSSGSYQEAALIYKEVVNCYARGENRAANKLQAAEGKNDTLRAEVQVLTEWIATHPSGFLPLSNLVEGITFWSVYGLLFGSGSCAINQGTLDFLAAALSELDIPVGSQGYSIERQTCGILVDYFSPSANENEELKSVRVRIAIDLIASEFLKRLNAA